MRFTLFASVGVIELQTTEAYSTLDLTNVKYNVNIHSRDEKLKVMLRTRHYNLIQSENIKLT
jgi:hypothetical protein